MSGAEILMFGPMMPLVQNGLAEKLTLHRLWEMDDKDAFLAENAASIRGIATGGHVAVTGDVMKQFPNLEIVANFGVGYDSVDAKYAGENNIIVTNTPDVLTNEVADTAMGLTLMTVRELSATERYLRAGKWLEKAYPLTKGTLAGKTMGILGFGRIGKAIAKRAQAFGIEIVYHGRNKQDDVDFPYYASLTDMAAAVDILMIVVPGGAATHHIVNAEVLKALGPNGFVINIGRGTAIDEPALIAALQNGEIQSAGLDVFENEPSVPQALIDMDHVVLLPHVGSASIHTRDGMGQLVVDNLVSWFEIGKVHTPVAETPAPKVG